MVRYKGYKGKKASVKRADYEIMRYTPGTECTISVLHFFFWLFGLFVSVRAGFRVFPVGNLQTIGHG